MPIENELRWLKTDNLSQVAKRFAEFCKDDIKQYENNDSFEVDIYQDAVKQVIDKLNTKATDRADQ